LDYYNSQIAAVYDHCLLQFDFTSISDEAKNDADDLDAIVHFPEVQNRIQNNASGIWAKFAQIASGNTKIARWGD
jgi:hypothetical protein